jgi:hypothetical protein
MRRAVNEVIYKQPTFSGNNRKASRPSDAYNLARIRKVRMDRHVEGVHPIVGDGIASNRNASLGPLLKQTSHFRLWPTILGPRVPSLIYTLAQLQDALAGTEQHDLTCVDDSICLLTFPPFSPSSLSFASSKCSKGPEKPSISRHHQFIPRNGKLGGKNLIPGLARENRQADSLWYSA